MIPYIKPVCTLLQVQLNQYIQVSTDVVHNKSPKKPLNKPLKSILKKPAKKCTFNSKF